MTADPIPDTFELLTVRSYANQAALTDQHSDADSLNFPLLGLFGETGSLLSEVKKKQRDRASYLGYAAAVVEEVGDVLWYLAAVTSRVGLDLEALAWAAAGNADARGTADAPVTFASLQPSVIRRMPDPAARFETTLLALAGEVGSLVAEYGATEMPVAAPGIERRLVVILRLLVQASNEAGVTLEAAAIKNLSKIFDRWPRDRTYPALADEDAPAQERLPRTLVVDIAERTVGGQAFVVQTCNGINVGDKLTDNAMIPDDYRFHDVFHFTHMAVLGWSPVMRSLLRLKRKSDPLIDEAEDGARAMLTEEGVTTWLFGQAQQLRFFEGVKPGELPLDLLKQVRQFVAGYEAERTPLWVWEEAILQGYDAFRFLQANRRARLHVDMAARSLRFEVLPA